jgi:hypothetical protein
MSRKLDRLLKGILILTSATMIVTWLPLVRGIMDGSSYKWGQSFIGISLSGNGVGGQYWVLVVQAVIGISLVYLGWRGARPPFHLLLLLWNVPSAVNAFFNAIRFPEEYRFQGDTLGVDVSVAWVGPLFWGSLALLSIVWVVRDLKRDGSREVPPWTQRNTILMTLVIALVPIQFLLLRFGTQHGTNDQIGVILTMVQWILLNLSFVAWQSPVSD